MKENDDITNALLAKLERFSDLPVLEQWRKVTEDLLDPTIPIEVHQALHQKVFSQWDGIAPAWSPTEDEIAYSNIGQIMKAKGFDNYEDFYRYSIEKHGEFIHLMLRRLGIVFEQVPSEILSFDNGEFEPEAARLSEEFEPEAEMPSVERPVWLSDASFNIVESCFSADEFAIAIVEDADGAISKITYGHLKQDVAKVVNSLAALGVKPGQRVGLAMPMNSRSVAIYLGVIAYGASIVSVAESFSVEEMRIRFEIANPACIFTQDVIVRGTKELALYEKVSQASSAKCIVSAASDSLCINLREQDLSWDSFLIESTEFTFAHKTADAEISLLFSSGTPGKPKAIPWNQTVALRAANDAHLHHDSHAGDVLCWPTSFGWMMGPWLVFAALLNRGSIALSQQLPTSRGFGEFVQNAGVTMLGLVPSLVSAWRASGCLDGLDLNAIRVFSSTGECSNADDMFYLMSRANYKPVIEYCGGTEIGGGYITGTVVQPAIPGTFSTAALGSSFYLLSDNGEQVKDGEVFIVAPALGLSVELVNQDHHESYFAGIPPGPNGEKLRRHGDHIEALGNGYYRAHGRVDDTMNLGGIKVSAVQIEELLGQIDSVKELAAIAVAPPGGGPAKLLIVAVLTTDSDCDDLQKTMQTIIRSQLNPLFKIESVQIIKALPRTASNKVMRRKLRDLFQKKVQ